MPRARHAEIAVAHVLWALERGQSPAETCHSVGLDMGPEPGVDDAIMAVRLRSVEMETPPLPQAANVATPPRPSRVGLSHAREALRRRRGL